MSNTKWCINCKKELGGSDLSLSMFGLSAAAGLYCKNTKCPRYGLLTAIFLEEEKKAPESVKSNDDLADSKEVEL